MSKKTLKRSLALGALMAFVITGSAMAKQTLTEDTVINNGIHYHDGYVVNDREVVLGDYTLTIDNQINDKDAPHAVKATGYSFTGSKKSSLIIEPGNGKTIQYGLAFYGTVNVGTVKITTSSNAIEALAGQTSITATNITLNSSDANGIAATEGGSVKITNTGKLSINARENGVLTAAGKIDISTSQLEINASAGNAFKTYDGVEGAEISVDAKGDAVVNGDIYTGQETSIKFTMNTAESVWNGAAVTNENATTNLTLNNSATWNMTGDSSVSSIGGKGFNVVGIDNKLVVDSEGNGISQGGTINVEELDITAGKSGIWSVNGVDIIADTVNIDADGNSISTYGAGVNIDAKTITLKAGTDAIFTEGIVSDGAKLVEGQSNDINITGFDSLTIESGEYAVVNNGNGNYTTNGELVKGDIIIEGNENSSIIITSKATDYHGAIVNNSNRNNIESGASSDIIISAGDITVDAAGVAVAGADGNTTITATNDLTITNNNADYAAVASGVISNAKGYTGNGTVNLSAGDKLEIKNNNSDGVALNAENGGDLIASASTMVVTGNVTASGSGSSINATFNGAASSLTGAITTAEDGATTTLTMNDGAAWNVTGDSNVTTVAGNEGKIVLSNTENTVAITTNENEALTVQADEALTKAIANGDTTLAAVAKAVSVKDGITEITAATQETDIAGATTLTYNAETGKLGALVNTIAKKNDNISDAGMNLKAHWRAHMNDMNKRMGDLRMANGETGVWTRMVRGESEYDGSKTQYNQYQLGYDEKLSVDKRWTVGAAVTFSEGDGSYGTGSTDDKSTAFAIYGSKLNNDGTFIDLIARYARLESDLEDIHSGNGDYSTNGYSVSAEFGKRIEQGNGLWVEPQVELTYGTVDSADFVLSRTKKEVHVDSMDSFVARAGFALGKDIKQGNVYARASYLYDFDGETETSFSANGRQGDVVKEDFGGGWWEVGVGANINLSKATYIYADVEKTFGGEVDTNWQWNLGVRYSF